MTAFIINLLFKGPMSYFFHYFPKSTIDIYMMKYNFYTAEYTFNIHICCFLYTHLKDTYSTFTVLLTLTMWVPTIS